MPTDDSQPKNDFTAQDHDKRDDPYLTVTEAADRLKIKRDTLDRWRMNGSGPVFRYHGGRVVYHIDELDDWSDDQRQTKARKFNRNNRRHNVNGGTDE